MNLGTVHGDMRASIQIIENRGQEQLARLLADLVARIPTTPLADPEKDDAVQLARTFAQEVATHPPGRLSAAARAVGSALGPILTRSAESRADLAGDRTVAVEAMVPPRWPDGETHPYPKCGSAVQTATDLREGWASRVSRRGIGG